MTKIQRETMSILFFIKRAKLLRNGEAPICVRVTVNKQAVEIRIKRSVSIDRWCQAKGCAKGKDRESKELNSFLDAVRLKILQIHRDIELEAQSPVSATAILERYYGKDQKMLLEVFKEHNDKCRALIGKEYVEGTIRKFDTSLLYMKQYLLAQYRKEDMPLQEIDQEFVRNFEFFLKTEKLCQNNSALKHIKNFRKVIRIAIGNEWIKKDPFAYYRFKLEETDPEFLTMDEIKIILAKEFTIKRVEQVRDVFVFCIFTGLAFSDVKDLSPEHLVKDNKGELWIRKNRQKTKIMCNIPVLPVAASILDKYKDVAECTGKLLPVLCNQRTNSYLKEIADVCGIHKNLSTHTARHSYATTVCS